MSHSGDVFELTIKFYHRAYPFFVAQQFRDVRTSTTAVVMVSATDGHVWTEFFGPHTVFDGFEQKSRRVGRSHPSFHLSVARAASTFERCETTRNTMTMYAVENFVRDAAARVIQMYWRRKSNDPNTTIGHKCILARYHELLQHEFSSVSET